MKRISALVVIVLTSACASSKNQIRRDIEEAYRNPAQQVNNTSELAPGYQIKISNLEDANLNGQFRIDFDGIVQLPYQIKIQTNNLTLAQLKDEIIRAYGKFFKTEPNMQITVIDKKYWVNVGGLVEKAGKILVKEDGTLDEIISKSGGLQKSQGEGPLAKYVRIQSKESAYTIKLSDYYTGSQKLTSKWRGGENIFFQSEGTDSANKTGPMDMNYIQMLGQIRNPGEYLFKANADFFYYLSKSGGPTDSANLDRITLIRTENAKRESTEFEIDEIDEIPTLRGGDILIVHSDHPTQFERNLDVTSRFAAILTSIASMILLFIAL